MITRGFLSIFSVCIFASERNLGLEVHGDGLGGKLMESFKERTGFDNLFDMLRDFHQQTADLFADGNRERVEIHCVDGNTSIIVDGVDIDWRERLEKNLFAYMEAEAD